MTAGRSLWVVLDAMGVVYPVVDDVTDLLTPYIMARGGPGLDDVYAWYLQASTGRITPRAF